MIKNTQTAINICNASRHPVQHSHQCLKKNNTQDIINFRSIVITNSEPRNSKLIAITPTIIRFDDTQKHFTENDGQGEVYKIV